MKNRKIILIASFLFFYAQYIYIPFQSTYLSSFGASETLVGIVTGAYGCAQLMLRLPAGVLADRIGRHKPFIVIGSLLAGLACVIRFLFPGVWGFFAASLLSGVSAVTWLSFMVMHSNCYDIEEQQKAAGKIIFACNAGILAAFVTGTLIYEYIGMRNLCILGIVAGIVGMGLSLGLIERPEVRMAPGVWELLKICTNKRLLFYSVLALVQQGIQMATTMAFTAQLLKELGAGGAIVGISSIIYMISSVGSSFFASTSISLKKSSRFWIATIFGGLAGYCIVVPLVQSIPVILILQLVPGLASGLLFSRVTAEAMMEVPMEKKSTAMGLFQAVYAIGMTTFPMITGSLAELSGMASAYFLLGVFSIGCIVAVLIRKHA